MDGNLDFVVAGGGSSPTVAFTGTGDGRFNPGATVFSGSAVAVAVSDFNEDARPDLMSTAGQLTEVLNATNATSGVASRAFLQSGGRSIPLNSSSSVVCAAIEPANGSFDVTTVDVPTIRLASEGTGVVQSIEASGAKSSIVGDSDKNGISDMAACFATRRLADLFSNLKGKRDVTAQLSGALLDGRRFCAPVTMTIIGNGTNSLAGRVEPNPLNPEGTLRFATKQPGAVSIRLFDVNGRLVRTVWNARSTVVGDHEARIDGRDADGRALRSGVYFYRIEGGGADETGRFTVLK